MRRASFFSVIGLVLLTSSASLAEPPNNGYIGIYYDVAGTQCCFSLPPVQNGNETIYVFYVTGGAAAAGIHGAEFKIAIEPPAPASTITWVPAQGIHVTSGNPIDNGNGGGCYIGANQNQCLDGTTGMAGDKILLGEIKVKDLYTETQLTVRPSDTPSDPNFACPSVFLCDGPAYTQVALTLSEGDPELHGEDAVGFVAVVNSVSCSGASCGVVAIEPSSWSLIKGLFR